MRASRSTHARQPVDDRATGRPATVGNESHRDTSSPQAEQRLAGTRQGITADVQDTFQIDQNTVDHFFLAGSDWNRIAAWINGDRSCGPSSFQ